MLRCILEICIWVKIIYLILVNSFIIFINIQIYIDWINCWSKRSDEIFNNIKKFIEFVFLLYFEFISQLNQFSETNYVSAVIQRIENHSDYFN